MLMKRKVNKVGPATLSITLPAKWVKENQIQKGEQLEVSSTENTLLIGKGVPVLVEEVKKELVHRGSLGYVKSVINNLYRRGYDILTLSYDHEETARFIAKAVQETMGYEIVEQHKESITIRNVAGVFEQEFDNSRIKFALPELPDDGDFDDDYDIEADDEVVQRPFVPVK